MKKLITILMDENGNFVDSARISVKLNFWMMKHWRFKI